MLLLYSVRSLSILITSVLESESDRLPISTLFSYFLEFCSIPLFWQYFFVSSIWQLPCVCVVGRATLTPCLRAPVKLYGVEPWVFTRAGSWLHCFVASYAGEGSKRGQCCCWLTSGGLPSIHPISSHFTLFLCVTGAPPAAALVVVPRVGGFAYVLDCLEKLTVSSAASTRTGFTARNYETLSFPHWNPGPCSLAWGSDCWLTKYLPDFYPPHVIVGLPIPPSTTATSWPPHHILSTLAPQLRPSYLSR